MERKYKHVEKSWSKSQFLRIYVEFKFISNFLNNLSNLHQPRRTKHLFFGVGQISITSFHHSATISPSLLKTFKVLSLKFILPYTRAVWQFMP